MNEREAVRKSYFFISALTVALLFGCSSTPQMDASASRQVLASTPKDQGEVIFFTIGQWMPNTKEFRFSADAQTPKIPGVVVVTNKNILFEQWGGSTGLSIVKKIAIADILDASFITFGASGRMIIQSQENQYDSFAASETTGVISIRKGTEEMHQAVSSLLRSRKRELNQVTLHDEETGRIDIVPIDWSSTSKTATKAVKESALAHFKEDLEAAVLKWIDNRAKSKKCAAIGKELAEFEEALTEGSGVATEADSNTPAAPAKAKKQKV